MRVWGNLDWEAPKGHHLFSFPFSRSLSFRRIRPLLDSSSAILIVIPRLSLSFAWKERKVGCPRFTSLISNGWRTEAAGPSPSFIRPLRITTRNYLTRITLETGRRLKNDGGSALNGWWFIHVRCKFAGTCVFHRDPMACSCFSNFWWLSWFFLPVLGC